MFFFFPDSNTGGSKIEDTPNELADIILYEGADGNVKVEIIFKDETFWLNQKRMADLFGVEVPAISKHLSNIFKEGELNIDSTVSKMEIVEQEVFYRPHRSL